MNLGFGTRVGLFLMRVLVGLEFILAAWSKVWPQFSFKNFATGWLKQPELKGYLEGQLKVIRPELGFFKNIVADVFLPNVNLLTYAVVFGELLVGIALVLGLLTRTAALFGVLMTATFFLVTWNTGPIVHEALKNPAFLTMMLCLLIFMSGAGLCGGLDAKIRRQR